MKVTTLARASSAIGPVRNPRRVTLLWRLSTVGAALATMLAVLGGHGSAAGATSALSHDLALCEVPYGAFPPGRSRTSRYATDGVTVFTAREAGEATTALWVCSRRTHVTHQLTPSECDLGCTGGRGFRYRRPYLAYERYQRGGREGDFSVVDVVALTSGRTLASYPTVSFTAEEQAQAGMTGPHGIGATTALVVTHRAVGAWIAREEGSNPATYQVGVGRGRAHRRVARGTGVGPTSLRITGDRLYWRQDEQQRSASTAP